MAGRAPGQPIGRNRAMLLGALVVIIWPTTAIVSIIPSIFPSKSVSLLGGIITGVVAAAPEIDRRAGR